MTRGIQIQEDKDHYFRDFENEASESPEGRGFIVISENLSGRLRDTRATEELRSFLSRFSSKSQSSFA